MPTQAQLDAYKARTAELAANIKYDTAWYPHGSFAIYTLTTLLPMHPISGPYGSYAPLQFYAYNIPPQLHASAAAVNTQPPTGAASVAHINPEPGLHTHPFAPLGTSTLYAPPPPPAAVATEPTANFTVKSPAADRLISEKPNPEHQAALTLLTLNPNAP